MLYLKQTIILLSLSTKATCLACSFVVQNLICHYIPAAGSLQLAFVL